MQPIIVIYHGGCPDGFASALAAKQFFKHRDIQFYAAQHGKKPPDCHDKEVYILDFSYHREVIIELASIAKQITIIDHHISAQNDLLGIEEQIDNIEVIFDMSHSGAILSWQFFHQSPPPLLFKIIEDRDIWKFDFPQTNDVMSAVVSHPMDFPLWESWLENEDKLKELEHEGRILNRERDKQVKKYRKRMRLLEIGGYQVPVVNAPASIASDLLQLLADGYPFAASYEDRDDRRVWQLRSAGEKQIDVSVVAQQFGGGGHKNASGFSTPLPEIEF